MRYSASDHSTCEGVTMPTPPHIGTHYPELKFGRLPNDPTKPRLRLSPFLRAEYTGQVPPTVDYLSSVKTWPMALNDRLGCCTASAACHCTEAWTTYGSGVTATPTDQDVLTFYELCSGYNPNNPSSDSGAVMQDCLNIWRKTGIGGHRIGAFFEINVTDLVELKAALYLFGGLYVGLNCPNSALQQFRNGQPWDVVPNDGGIAGGHCVHLGCNVNGQDLVVTTWGRLQHVTPRFWARYMEEAWAPVSFEWISANKAPQGLDVVALNAAFQQLTGQPGPFPVAPTPTPTPTPVVDAADQALVTAVGPWATQGWHPWTQNIADAINTWRRAKGI